MDKHIGAQQLQFWRCVILEINAYIINYILHKSYAFFGIDKGRFILIFKGVIVFVKNGKLLVRKFLFLYTFNYILVLIIGLRKVLISYSMLTF